MDLAQEVSSAALRIAPHVRRTPVERSLAFAPPGDAELWLKLEGYQLTGSFKLRGAMNKLLGLEPAELGRGVVAASSGNHGLAVAHGARTLGEAAVVFAPQAAARSKLDAIRSLGAEVREVGEDCIETEAAARAYAAESGRAYVAPYNDPAVVAGQGTVGLELDEDLERLDAIFVSVGGGGLVAGLAGYLAHARPDVEVIGCSPARSAVMAASVEAGSLLDLPSEPTLSDGTAGGVEPGSITFELCSRHVDRWALVEEDEIAAAMRAVIETHHVLVEGAAGVALAAYLRERERWADRSVAVVLCGANVDSAVLRSIL